MTAQTNLAHSSIAWNQISYLVMPVVKDISGEPAPLMDGGNEILKSDRIPAITNNIDVSAK